MYKPNLSNCRLVVNLLWVSLLLSLGYLPVVAQRIQLPTRIPTDHPRLLTHQQDKAILRKRLETEAWAKKLFEVTKTSIDPYVNRHQTDSTWIVSRLQMYWKSHSTDVFIRGGTFAYATGNAPVPTVRFTGTRDVVTVYTRPKLDEVQPYMDEKGLYLQNGGMPGKPWEWVEPSKSGRIVEAINREIMGLAEKAAFIYWYTGEEKYARFAYDIFNMYMTGMYYRKEPVDLNHGHAQTLVGLSSFEVIHEDILDELVPCYDFLHAYVQQKAPQQLPLYADTFRKWSDIIIKNGVPFNNWDLFEARFVALIALVLEDNQQYADGRGCQYYLDRIFNQTVTRQWALVDLIRRGYDANTGIWSECAGYSQGVINDFTELVSLFGKVLKFDLIPQMPIIPKAVQALPQYLFPNGSIVGFGDSHYGPLNPTPIRRMIENAQLFHKPDQETRFTRLLKMLEGEAGEHSTASGHGPSFAPLFAQEFTLKQDVTAGKLADFVTPTFYAPNVSWLVQRSGTDPQTGLMISQAGSMGNHAHSNGIAMELYGKGLVLAPEGGIGTTYFQPDYAEYYSQFPAHNTVVVDGISAYPAMRSNHGFQVKACYPVSGQAEGYFPMLTFSSVSFIEPETIADQQRTMGIIRSGGNSEPSKSGYYVDIFRSRRQAGNDKRHDYFYHNLGQTLSLADQRGKPLALKPSEQLTFADGDLMAYDYLWDKKSVVTDADIKATFTLQVPGKEEIQMRMWLKGAPGREIFAVKAPPSKAFRHNVMIPDSIAAMPLPTLVARQTGEAWTRPFVAVYEPASATSLGSIQSITAFQPAGAPSDFVGLVIESDGGNKETISSSIDVNRLIRHQDLAVEAGYAVVSEGKSGLNYLFMSEGRQLAKGGWSITATTTTSAAIHLRIGELFVMTDKPVTLTIPTRFVGGHTKLQVGNQIFMGRKTPKGLVFALPKLAYQQGTLL